MAMSKSPNSSVGTLFRRFNSFRKSVRKQLNKQRRHSLSHEAEQITKEKFDFEAKEIPLNPCSVLQIKDYIQEDMLKEAYLNLLSKRLELQREWKELEGKTYPVNIVNKEKDINMLFEALRNKMSDIVRSSTAPSCDKELLVHVVHIILEEEKKQGEPGAMQGWRESWRDAVQDGVRDTLKKVHLDSREQNASWLAVHLGLLGEAVVEDLERVKTELLSLYPEDFNVYETYVSCHHKAVGEHLTSLLEKMTELNDYCALLEFIFNCCPSELGDKGTLMKEDSLNKIKTSYCDRQLKDFKTALENIIQSEKDVWKMKKGFGRTDDGFLTSKIHTDICQLIANYAKNLEKTDENLGDSVVCCCLEELNPFHTRFEEVFSQDTSSLLTSDLLDVWLWVQYHITYINTFNSLKENVQCYREKCSAQVEQVEKQVDGLTQRLIQILLEHFKTDVKPFMDGMMTKEWLKTDKDFEELSTMIGNYSGLCQSMSAPSAQVFVNEVHCYVAKEYISQLMKKKYSCKKNKNADAAIKMREQWNELKKLFVEMGSSLDWLYPLGDYLTEIIGTENEKNIKNLLVPLVSNYPDIRKKHLSALLYFRDNGFSLEKHNVINHFNTLIKRDAGNTNHKHSFFTDIEVL